MAIFWFRYIRLLYRGHFLIVHPDEYTQAEYYDEFDENGEIEIDSDNQLMNLTDFRYKLEPWNICANGYFGG